MSAIRSSKPTYRLYVPIILEGANTTGKSTLSNAFADHGIPCYHTGGTKRTQEEMQQACEKVLRIERSMIIDRVPMISQVAYDRALDRTPVEHPHRTLGRLLGMRSPLVIVHCTTADLLLAGALPDSPNRDAEHNRGVQANVQKLLLAYETILNGLAIRGVARVIRYDKTLHKPAQFVQWMLEEMSHEGVAVCVG